MQNLDVGKHKDNVSNEAFEDAECGDEWPNSSSIDLYAIASAAGRLAGNLNTRPGALDDFFNKLKVLEHEWYEAEKKYHALKIENDKLSNQLINERTRCAIYQKKLKFIQDNQKNFERLKQVYLNMKYQEAAGRSMVEIREKASQTQSDPRFEGTAPYHGIISMFGHSDSKISVKMSDLTEAQENLRALKDMVRRREYTWALNKKREDLLRDEIKKLERENEKTAQMMRAKDLEIDAMKVIDENESSKSSEEDELKKIVLKMDKRLRELEKVGKIGRYNVIFSEKEKKLINELSEKDSKQLKKANSRGVVSSPLFGLRPPMNRTASSPLSKTTRLPMKVNASATNERKTTDKRHQHVAEGLNEIRELEILAKIRRGIEKKQAALKEKVQDLIDYTDIPGACPISTHH